MPCLIAILACSFPRLVIAAIWLFSDYFGRAYATRVWPILGFIFMPLTTLAYAFAINSNGNVTGFYLFLVVLAAFFDLGTNGIGPLTRRKRHK